MKYLIIYNLPVHDLFINSYVSYILHSITISIICLAKLIHSLLVLFSPRKSIIIFADKTEKAVNMEILPTHEH